MRQHISRSLLALAVSTAYLPVAGASGALEEVIVTAQKKEESMQDTPISLLNFDTGGLEKRGINTLVDLAPNVPNLQITPHPNSAQTLRVFIRGVGNTDDQITQDASVATYLDGVYIARSQGLAMDVSDISRIEVLRGPQGSLYGRNATGGAINFVTAAPELERLGFKQSLTLGTHDEFRSKSLLNVPVSDTFAVKAGYLYARKDGFVDNPGTGEGQFGAQDRAAYRIDGLWRPTDNLSVRYAFDRSEIDDSPAYSDVVPLYPQQGDRPERGDPAVRDLQANDITAQGHTLTAEWHLNDAMTLKSITGYRELDSFTYQDYNTGLFGPFPLFIIEVDGSQDQFSEELQLLGTALDNRLEYIAGLFYLTESGDVTSVRDMPAQQSGQISEQEIENTAAAVFGQATYTPDILERRLHITLGARWSYDQREAELAEVAIVPEGPPMALGSGVGDEDFDEFTPSLFVAYDLSDDVNLYGKIVSGYKTGGFNIRASSIENFEKGFGPETLISYEFGIKSEFWERRARLNLAAFFSDYDDIQMSTPNPDAPGEADVQNVGEAEIKGLELDFTVLLGESLTLSLNYGYLDAEYSRIDQADIDQYRFINAPEHTYNLDVDYAIMNLFGGELAANINYSWQDQRFSVNSVEQGEFIIDDYGLLNARLSLSGIPVASGDLQLALWGRNLDDEEYYRDHYPISRPNALWGEERSYGVDVIYEF